MSKSPSFGSNLFGVLDDNGRFRFQCIDFFGPHLGQVAILQANPINFDIERRRLNSGMGHNRAGRGISNGIGIADLGHLLRQIGRIAAETGYPQGYIARANGCLFDRYCFGQFIQFPCRARQPLHCSNAAASSSMAAVNVLAQVLCFGQNCLGFGINSGIFFAADR